MGDRKRVAGYRVVEPLYIGSRSRVYRVEDRDAGRTLIAKMLAPDSPPEEDAVLHREFELLRSCSAQGVVRVIDLVLDTAGQVLLMHDIHGRSLRVLSRERVLQLNQVVAVAEKIADALDSLHQQNIIHRDINPANIVFNPETMALEIIDFGAASRDVGLRVPFRGPGRYQGTYAYMAPEQTGRVNRTVDHRADLYGFGATLYELLTGRPPFLATDPLDLVHCHIARQPPAPTTLDPRIPPTLSALVMKLLAKDADERYPSAAAILADLRKLREYWHTHGVFPELSLESVHSHRRQFHLGDRLYGRAAHLAQLSQNFVLATSGTPTVVFISGEPGIGKTSLVRELYQPITRHQGYFISGKCQQLRRDEPLGPFVQAMEELCYQLMGSEKDRRLEICEQLGSDGVFLREAFPVLAPVLRSLEHTELHSQATPELRRRRIQAGLSTLINFMTADGRPLVLFLDDLQWADLSSFDALHYVLIHAGGPLLFIGAYRNDEIPNTHPLRQLFKQLDHAAVPTQTLHLNPLNAGDIESLIMDVFSVTGDRATGLARIAADQTQGNPFFLIHYLRTLCEEGLITYDPQKSTWRWDLPEIQHVHAPSNDVLDFLLHKLQQLPGKVRTAVELAACIGDRFGVGSLLQLWPDDPQALRDALEQAITAGLILPEDDGFRLAYDLGQAPDIQLRFAHDRIAQAAESLLDDQQRKHHHLRIARALRTTDTEVFSAVDYYARARDLLTEPTEGRAVASLEYEAGLRARRCAAFSEACKHYRRAIELFEEFGGQHSDKMHLCQLELAECSALTGDDQFAAELCDRLLAFKLSIPDRARALELRLLLHINHNEVVLAVASALEVLPLLGIEIPATPEARGRYYQTQLQTITEKMAQMPVEAWADFPTMRDPIMLAAMRVIRTTLPAAFQCDTQLFALLVGLLTALSLQHGNSPDSPTGYTFYGVLVIVSQQDYVLGQRFGRLGLELDARLSDPALRAWVYFGYAAFIQHWTEPLTLARDLLEQSVRWARESGDQTRGGYSLFHLLTLELTGGIPLSQLQAVCERQLRDLKRLEDRPNLVRIQALLRLIHALHEPERALPDTDETEGDSNHTVVHFGQVLALQRAVLIDLYGYNVGKNLDATRALAHRSLAGVRANLGKLVSADNVFYAGLAFAFGTDLMPPADGRALEECIEKLGHWADHCPENFAHRHALLQAEAARRSGDTLRAMNYYETAIANALAQDAVNDAALASEIAGLYLEGNGVHHAAQAYLDKARDNYRAWEAATKVEILNNRHNTLLGVTASATASTRDQHHALDLVAVVKASEALTRIASVEQLCSRLMEVVLEEAGAQRAMLLLRDEQDFVVVADVVTASGIRRTQTGLTLDEAAAAAPPTLPGSVLQQTLTRETSLIVENADTDPRCLDDPYIQQNDLRSLMALPLRRQGALNGLLYLENRLLPGAFSRDRLQILDLLSGQIAISLDNARAYEQMRDLNTELEQRMTAEAQSADQLRQLNSDLTQARDEALRANRAKSMFLANMSHELRTPLNAIIGYTELVLEEQQHLSEGGQDDLRHVLQAGGHLLQLINEVLDLSRVESGHTRLQLGPVEVASLLASIGEIVTPLVRANQNQLVIHLSPTSDALTTDETRLRQLLLNIVGNATKFTHNGTISVTVVSQTHLGVEGVEFQIADTGIGIDPSQLSRVFEPFTQADESSTRRFGGTGLGLAISRHIVEALGGRIGVESTVDVGTTFTIWLPREHTQHLPTPTQDDHDT